MQKKNNPTKVLNNSNICVNTGRFLNLKNGTKLR
jgi:hypothetical protein